MITFNRISGQVKFGDLSWGDFFVIDWQNEELELCMKTEPMEDKDEDVWNYVSINTGQYGNMFDETKVTPANVDIDVDY